jgi:hypothetical protein
MSKKQDGLRILKAEIEKLQQEKELLSTELKKVLASIQK